MKLIGDMIWVAVVIGFIAIPMVPPLLILRGQRFWAPWTMLGAVVSFGLTLAFFFGAEFYYEKEGYALAAAWSGVPWEAYQSPEWVKLEEQKELTGSVCSVLLMLSFPVYALGLFGVASRWKETSRRVKELEAKTVESARLRDFKKKEIPVRKSPVGGPR